MKVFAGVIAGLGIISLIIFCITIFLWGYWFDRDCGNYLKLAGDAPNIERTESFLRSALAYIDSHHLTEGNTAWIFKTPENDLSIWHGQIVGAWETASSLILKAGKATQLEKDNALMKIRETVLDEGQAVQITHPANISWYPHIAIMWLWLWFSSLTQLFWIVVLWDSY